MVTRHTRTNIMHRVVEHNGTLYLSGIIADDLSLSMKGQTEQVLAKIEKLLIEFGSSKKNMIAATIYITDMNKKAEMNEAWTSAVEPEHLPTRATIGVADLGPNTLIEVVVTAVK